MVLVRRKGQSSLPPRSIVKLFGGLALCTCLVLLFSFHTAVPTPAPIRAAVCHKTLFGNVQLDRVLKWVDFHHRLGFDHFFIWYMPEIRNATGFDILSRQPIVTMLENTQVRVEKLTDRDHVVVGEQDQVYLEGVCLGQVAKDYDWV